MNQTSVVQTTYDKNLLDKIRASINHQFPDGKAGTWTIAHYFHSTLKTEIAQCPQDNIVSLLPYISNYENFYKSKIGKPRESTFEVSNLGAFDPSFDDDDDDGKSKQVKESNTDSRNDGDVDGWRIENILFSQGPQVLGPAFAVNCASLSHGRGPLNLVLSWQDGVVEEEIIDAIANGFEQILEQST